jgi:hypothetical protein
MKIALFIYPLLIFNFCLGSLSGQTWQWAREEGAGPEGFGVCNDNLGNVYTAGYINGTAVIGTYTFTGGTSALIVKYDADGNLLWANNCPGSVNAVGYGVACDASGNVFLAGYFSGSVTVGTQTLVSAGGVDILLVKYSSNGSIIWAANIGGAGPEVANGVCVDTQGNPIVCGYMGATTFTVGSSVLTSTSTQRYIAVKCSGSGMPQWGVNGIMGTNLANSICSDPSDNIYFTGSYSGSFAVGTSSSVSAGGNDFFIAKYSPAGAVVWCNTGSGSGNDVGWCTRMEPSGDIYASGGFATSFTISGTNFSSLGSSDWFYARYSQAGTLLSTNHGGGTGNEVAYSIQPYSGGLFMAGSLGIQGMTFGFSTLTPTVNSDAMYFCQLDVAGNPLYGSAVNGGGDDVMALTIYNGCNLYLAGDILTTTITLGTFTLTHPTSVTEALFVAKFNTGINSPTLALSNYTLCQGSSLTLSVSGASTYTWTGGPNTNTYLVNPSTTTNYIIAGSSTSGCSTKTFVNVTVTSSTVTTSVATPTPFCSGSTATLMVAGASTYTWSNGATSSVVVISPTISGTYSVNGVSSTGCTYYNTQTISVLPAPSVSASANQTVICKGKSASFTVTGANTYTWSNGSHATVITLTPSAATTVSVTGTDTLTGCTATSVAQVSVQNCQGIEAEDGSHGVNIFPNPSSGNFDITFRSSSDPGRLIIQDVNGKILIDQQITSSSAVHVSGILPGLYFIMFVRDGSYTVGKIIVE